MIIPRRARGKPFEHLAPREDGLCVKCLKKEAVTNDGRLCRQCIKNIVKQITPDLPRDLSQPGTEDYDRPMDPEDIAFKLGLHDL